VAPRLRQARILERVRRHGHVRVEDLAEDFGASQETIRRDLAALAEAGAVMKVHGGAKLPRRRDEGPFMERMATHEPAKREIAAKAARLLTPGETMFVDTGTTTLVCAQEAARVARLTVVTNSARIAATFAEGPGGARVFLVGGNFEPDNGETVGPMAIAQIRSFHADHAILGVGALDAESGATNVDFDEAQVAQAMIGMADRVVVLADSSKFDRRAAFAVCPLERIDHLVCDRPPEGALAEALADAGVSVQ
jgi:DeoR family glycerol-3-phosphate regulon repressor